MSLTLQNLRRDSEARTVTDTRVSPLWVLLPVLEGVTAVVFVGVIFAMVFSFIMETGTASTDTAAFDQLVASLTGIVGALTGALFVMGLVWLYVIYLLVRRRNQHFARQQAFFSDVAAAIREIASKRGVAVEGFLGSMEATSRQAQVEETEKSAILWVILMVIPVVSLIATLYILYFLTGDFYRHERREDGILADVSHAVSALGLSFTFERMDAVPHRSFALYLILTIITFGIFGLYWYYVLIRDPNGHFANHDRFEDSLVQALAPMLT